MLAYGATAGLLQSAHEGQILGRRWSSMWAPLRIVLAVALLVPVPGLGGYNAIQASVAWIVKGSTMLASEVWRQGARALLAGEIPVSGSVGQLDPELFKSVYRNQLCVRLANYQFEAAGSHLRVEYRQFGSEDATSLISAIGDARQGICGSYRIPEPPEYVERLGPEATLAVGQQFRDLHAGVLRLLIESADRMISRQWRNLLLADDSTTDIAVDVADAVNAANELLNEGGRRIVATVARSVNETGDARGTIEGFMTGGDCDGDPERHSGCFGEGWIGAGNWYMTIARVNAEMMGLLNASVSATESGYIIDEADGLNRVVVSEADDLGWIDRMLGSADIHKYLHAEEATRIWRAANGDLERASTRLAALGMELSGRIGGASTHGSDAGLFGRIWQVGFSAGLESVIDAFSPGSWDYDPMLGIVRMGNWCLNVAGVLIFSGSATSFLSDGLGSVLIFLVAAPLVSIGLMQSFIIPMLPFFFWVLAVTGYFLLVVEAVVAGSLWAMAHFRLDGEGISGDAGRTGWHLLLGLALAPTLMILGYFAGMAMFRVVAGLFDAGMHHALGALANASPVVGVFGLIAAGFMIVIAYLIMIERSFSLISEFPNRVLRWIGSQADVADNVGERGLASGIKGISASVGGGTTTIGTTLSRIGGNGSRQAG